VTILYNEHGIVVEILPP